MDSKQNSAKKIEEAMQTRAESSLVSEGDDSALAPCDCIKTKI